MEPFSVAPADERIYAILAEAGFAGEPFNPRQHRCCELVERYVLGLTIELVRSLGVSALLREPRTVTAVAAAGRFVAAFHAPLRWLLERLVLAGLIARDGAGDPRYVLREPLPPTDVDAIKHGVLASDGSYASVLALLDEAAAIYPRVARGEITGERALFQKVALWAAYFNNDNAYYALTNHVAAPAAAAHLGGEAGAVLEVGAGLGSATELLLGLLRARGAIARVTAYHVTEPVAFFRRRAERTLHATYPEVPLRFGALDINRPWRDQGVEPGHFQLVWGVNVFHLARSLQAALGEAFIALAPGGRLVIGEGMRPFRGQPVGAEFPFQLLESFTAVETDPETRATPGFLTAEEWLGALGRAGFASVELVPDVIRMRALYPGFFAAAICGLRP